MLTIHLVPHTHWDREWYRTFEDFRFRLVKLIDSLLDILSNDPDYLYFMLDGQTIVLEDYLEIRPERADALRHLIQEGRIQIGPWYILPDEFLVSPEATIRNLLIGRETARQYGSIMPVGYIPDPFGHIGQMPQILQGFGIEFACLWRGMEPAPSEFGWRSPDGSQVFLCNLRESYSNAWDVLAAGVEGFDAKIREKVAALVAATRAPHLLLMFGTDHQMPNVLTTSAVNQFQADMGKDVQLLHSTLPAYAQAAKSWFDENKAALPIIQGELRTSPYINLLPGVLSTRIWIKQRNAACEMLMERLAEPSTVWAAWMKVQTGDVCWGYLNYAWRLLMQNHPHDSICGCSIDAVHAEMLTRFEKVEQVGWQVARNNLEVIAQQIDTQSIESECFTSMAVFNPLQYTRSDVVKVALSLPPAVRSIEVVAPDGSLHPCAILSQDSQTVARYEVDQSGLLELAPLLQGGNAGYGINGLGVYKEGKVGFIDVVMEQEKPSDPQAISNGLQLLQSLLSDESIEHFSVHAHTPNHAKIEFVACDVPGFGYRTFSLKSVPAANSVKDDSLEMENEWLKVEVNFLNGSLTLTDLETGVQYPELNTFSDGGDVGDEYNYSPPVSDELITSHSSFQSVKKTVFPDHQELSLHWRIPIPTGTTPDRKGRVSEITFMEITSRISLYPKIKRVDFETSVTQHGNDHRLRVHFPVPFSARSAWHDGHFEVVERPIQPPVMEAYWSEQRRPEVPQRAFTDLSDGEKGLMLAVRGLPEVAVQTLSDGNIEVVLTLLRCVGWLSRDDFSTRKGHAGPMLATPGAQMHGMFNFNYSMIPHKGKWEQAVVEGYAFSNPLVGIDAERHQGSLENQGYFLKVEPDTFHVTAVKPSADGVGWILRGCNLTDHPVDCVVRLPESINQVYLANMAEERQQKIPVSPDGKVTFAAGPHKVVTLRIE